MLVSRPMHEFGTVTSYQTQNDIKTIQSAVPPEPQAYIPLSLARAKLALLSRDLSELHTKHTQQVNALTQRYDTLTNQHTQSFAAQLEQVKDAAQQRLRQQEQQLEEQRLALIESRAETKQAQAQAQEATVRAQSRAQSAARHRDTAQADKDAAVLAASQAAAQAATAAATAAASAEADEKLVARVKQLEDELLVAQQASAAATRNAAVAGSASRPTTASSKAAAAAAALASGSIAATAPTAAAVTTVVETRIVQDPVLQQRVRTLETQLNDALKQRYELEVQLVEKEEALAAQLAAASSTVGAAAAAGGASASAAASGGAAATEDIYAPQITQLEQKTQKDVLAPIAELESQLKPRVKLYKERLDAFKKDEQRKSLLSACHLETFTDSTGAAQTELQSSHLDELQAMLKDESELASQRSQLALVVTQLKDKKSQLDTAKNTLNALKTEVQQMKDSGASAETIAPREAEFIAQRAKLQSGATELKTEYADYERRTTEFKKREAELQATMSRYNVPLDATSNKRRIDPEERTALTQLLTVSQAKALERDALKALAEEVNAQNAQLRKLKLERDAVDAQLKTLREQQAALPKPAASTVDASGGGDTAAVKSALAANAALGAGAAAAKAPPKRTVAAYRPVTPTEFKPDAAPIVTSTSTTHTAAAAAPAIAAGAVAGAVAGGAAVGSVSGGGGGGIGNTSDEAVNALRTELSTSSAKIRQLEADLATRHAEIESLKRTASGGAGAMQKELSDIQKQLSSSTHSLQEEKEVNHSLAEQLKASQHAHSQAEQQAAAAQAAIVAANAASSADTQQLQQHLNEQHMAAVAQLQAQHATQAAELDARIQQLSSELSAALAQSQQLAQQLADEQVARQSADSNVIQLTSQVAEISASSAAALGAVAGLQSTIQQRDSTIAERDNQIVAVTSEKDKWIGDYDFLNVRYIEEQKRRKEFQFKYEDAKGKIRVYARVRPFTKAEIANGEQTLLRPGKNEWTLELNETEKDVMGKITDKWREFAFDHVFQFGLEGSKGNATQQHIYEETKQFADLSMSGINCCVFAYGQSGTGKTFTMAGVRPSEENGMTQDLLGLKPRMIRRVYDIKQENRLTHDYEISCYMVEIYLNQISDLFWKLDTEKALKLAGKKKSEAPEPPELKVRVDAKKKVTIDGVKINSFATFDEMTAYTDEAENVRRVRKTGLNEASSRSHLIFAIMINATDKKTGKTVKGKLSLVDLAGSERADKTNVDGLSKKERESMMAEGVAINESLRMLKNVFRILGSQSTAPVAKGAKPEIVQYRGNMLTEMMQDSLGGAAKTLMFVNVGPAASNISESIDSLQYGDYVLKISNEVATADEDMIEQVRFLKQQVLKYEEKFGAM